MDKCVHLLVLRVLCAVLSLLFTAIGPRLETVLLRQPALEDLTNLPRTESPHRCDRNKSNHVSNGGGGRRAAGGGRRAARGGAATERRKWRGGGGLVSRVCVMLLSSFEDERQYHAPHLPAGLSFIRYEMSG
ncbi:hypothetical protein F511_28899 [Dorcoceras hygrometricum]|uniref:Uncharacterized protein n=1 Tax=Dorcoceras hygrometricum TaxID=472368 RepID=A0A2Z7CKA7_9LAMI|nr:hypothetical protein F511_28899 [Dorcoceras hygrometricum]